MKSTAVNISFNRELLEQIDKVAREESRSRSDLLREAARSYIQRKRRWAEVFSFGNRQTRKIEIKEADVSEEIAAYRAQKNE